MHAVDVLRYGHLTVLRTLDGLSPSEWETPGVCGVWSVREIIAHLASFEQMLVELLAGFLDEERGPTLARFMELSGEAFNDVEVAARQGQSPAETLAELEECHAQVMALARRIPAEQYRIPGTLPWYGAQYDLDDFIAYTFYGHKREHSAQIMVFRDGNAER